MTIKNVSTDIVDSIFFNMMITAEALSTLQETADYLLSPGPDVALWNLSPGFPGSVLRMVDQDTYTELRRIWENYASKSRNQAQFTKRILKESSKAMNQDQAKFYAAASNCFGASVVEDRKGIVHALHSAWVGFDLRRLHSTT
jgi:hypothetical protein